MVGLFIQIRYIGRMKTNLSHAPHPFLDFRPRKSDVRRMEIVQVVVDCLAKYGVQGTTFERVGNRLKMKRSHVAYYFPDRDKMIEAAVRRVMAAGQEITAARVQSAHDGKAKLNAIVEGALEWLERYPKYATVMSLFFYLASYDKAYKKLHTELRKVGEGRIYSILQILFGSQLDDRALRKRARDIQAILTGNMTSWVTTNIEASLAEVKERTLESIWKLLEGREI